MRLEASARGAGWALPPLACGALLALLAILAGAAPRAGAAELSVAADPDTIRVGDPIRLRLRLERAPGEAFTLPAAPRQLGEFEVLSWNAGRAKRRGSAEVQEGEARVTAWRTGALVLPAVRAEGDSASAPRSKPLRIQVASVGLGKGEDLRPLKDPRRLPMDKRLIALAAAVLLLAAAGVWYLIRRARRPLAAAVAPVVLRPAHEIAYAELEALAALRLVEAGRPEEHVERLADVLRRYVEARCRFPAMEMTTSETFERLRGEWGAGPRETREALAALRELLEEADLVKFAEVVPERETAAGALGRARKIVDETRVQEAAPPAAAAAA